MGYASKVRSVRKTTDTPVPVFLDEMSPEEITKEIGTGKTRVWSDQQKKIFHWFATSKIGKKIFKNLIVVARAGTGKTTTIVEAINHIEEGLEVLLAAFNKRIAAELVARVSHPNATVKTLHAVGYAIILEYWQRVKIANGDLRARALALEVCGKETPNTILRLVMKLHTKAREITPYILDDPEWFDTMNRLAMQFECDPEPFWRSQGYDLRYVIGHAMDCVQLAKDQDDCPSSGIDYADMIFIPLVKGWAIPRYDVGVVDEAQDMTVAQLELFRRVIKPDGRICVIGDDRQAIYAFRGADSRSLERLREELQAGELGLTRTYRCGKRIVAEAREKFVPDFEADESNSDGVIRTIVREDLIDEVQYGDFILSRLNAPLAGYAMQLLKQQRRARIAGRDIGQTIKQTLRKFTKDSDSIETCLDKLRVHYEKQFKRFTVLKWEAKIAELNDMTDTLKELILGCDHVDEIEPLIDHLFSDDGLGDKGLVTLSSVHKAKGLEADRVYVLGWTLRTGKNQEEDNIHYVAMTRARDVLTMVQ